MAGAASGGASRGLDVVVKVQHPGIDRIMRDDLFNLALLVKIVAYFEPEFDFRPVLDEWSAEAEKELDFSREGRITRRVGRALKAAGTFVRTPAVLDVGAAVRGLGIAKDAGNTATRSRSSAAPTVEGGARAGVPSLRAAVPRDGEEPDAYDGGDADGKALDGKSGGAPSRILLLEFVDGFKITDQDKLREAGADPTQLLLGVCEAFGVQMHLLGLFNGDPHPGNILVERVAEGEEGWEGAGSSGDSDPAAGSLRPVLLDFGLAKLLPESSRIAFCEMVQASFLNDFATLYDAFERMGVQLTREQPMDDMVGVRYLLRDVEPPAKARARMLRQRKWMQEKRKERLEAKQRRPVEAFPGDLLFYLRTSELLHGLGSALGAELPYLTVVAGFGRLAMRAFYAGTDPLFPGGEGEADVAAGSGALIAGAGPDGNEAPPMLAAPPLTTLDGGAFDGEGEFEDTGDERKSSGGSSWGRDSTMGRKSSSLVQMARSIQEEGGAWAPSARAHLAIEGLLAGEQA